MNVMPGRTCAILQPHYLPWLGYFEMMDRVDVFVYLDDVQFIKREWKNRNRIRKTPIGGDTKWLTVPIRREDQRAPLNRARVSGDVDWIKEHLDSIRHVYGRAPFFSAHFPGLEDTVRAQAGKCLADVNIDILRWLGRELGIETPCRKSSEVGAGGRREEKLLNICKAIGADFYLANTATATYVQPDYFGAHDIGFATQDYRHPRYPQTHKGQELEFISNLSVIDLLFNTGGEAMDHIRAGRPAATAGEDGESTQGTGP